VRLAAQQREASLLIRVDKDLNYIDDAEQNMSKQCVLEPARYKYRCDNVRCHVESSYTGHKLPLASALHVAIRDDCASPAPAYSGGKANTCNLVLQDPFENNSSRFASPKYLLLIFETKFSPHSSFPPCLIHVLYILTSLILLRRESFVNMKPSLRKLM
jgi:hypothetical protein